MSGRESIHNGVVTHPLSEERADQLYVRRDGSNTILGHLKPSPSASWDLGAFLNHFRVGYVDTIYINKSGGGGVLKCFGGNMLQFTGNALFSIPVAVPYTVVTGAMYYDYVADILYVYDGANWKVH